MSSFPWRRLEARALRRAGPAREAAQQHWRHQAPTLIKEFGAIDYIDFSPVEPHFFAVTCSVRVQVYNAITKQVVKNLSRFRECAYGGSFRSDGKLIVAGGDENLVRLFDVQSRSLLRLFSGHKAPVHRTFFTQKQTNVASFSDDKTVCVWDIATESKMNTFAEHEDYIRAGSVSPVSPDIILSGGYDGKIKMYDIRTGKSVITVDHESPVESTLFLPTGGIFISCGGTEVKVWDAFTGGNLLARMSQHHKTITCLNLASENKRLLSGSLDRHVKIYDLNTFKVVHTLDYPNAILSLAIPQNDETLVVGMVDGLISVRKREDVTKTEEKNEMIATPDISRSYVDQVVPQLKTDKMARYDLHIKNFQFSKALDVVLFPYIATKTPEITVSIFQELIRNKTLHGALAGRDDKSLISILKFLSKNIGDARFMSTLSKVGNIFMDVYGHDVHSFQPGVLRYFKIFEERLNDVIELTKDMASLEGVLSLLLAGASVGSDALINEELPAYHTPSKNADKNFVINVS